MLNGDLHPHLGIAQVVEAGFRTIRPFLAYQVFHAPKAVTRCGQELGGRAVAVGCDLLVVVRHADETGLRPANGVTSWCPFDHDELAGANSCQQQETIRRQRRLAEDCQGFVERARRLEHGAEQESDRQARRAQEKVLRSV